MTDFLTGMKNFSRPGTCCRLNLFQFMNAGVLLRAIPTAVLLVLVGSYSRESRMCHFYCRFTAVYLTGTVENQKSIIATAVSECFPARITVA